MADLGPVIEAMDGDTARRLLWGICAELNTHMNGGQALSPELIRIEGIMLAHDLRVRDAADAT